jgi:hypothetical protein
LDVKAYNDNFATLSPGSIVQFSQTKATSSFTTVCAKNGDALSFFDLTQSSATTTIYLLVNASGTAAPTITRAPDGVTF